MCHRPAEHKGILACAIAPLRTAQSSRAPVLRDGMVLTFGCCLYLLAGVLLGIPLHAAMTRSLQPSLRYRLIACTMLSLLAWQFVFYGVLSWMQPLLFRGDWIASGKYLPWWVAGVTPLIFGWTQLLPRVPVIAVHFRGLLRPTEPKSLSSSTRLVVEVVVFI